MSRFLVLPTDHRFPSASLIATDAGSLLLLIHRLDCKEADVTEDGVYIFTLRMGDNGVWAIFDRYPDCTNNSAQLFG